MSRTLLLNNNNDRVTTNPLSSSSNLQRRIGFRRRWESLRRNNQSVESNARSNATNSSVAENEGTFSQRNVIPNNNNTIDLSIAINNNSDTNLIRSTVRPNNISNNANNSNINSNTNNIVNSNNSITANRYAESPTSEYRRLRRRNFLGRQYNHNLLFSIFNNNNQNSNGTVNSNSNNNNSNSNNNNSNNNNNDNASYNNSNSNNLSNNVNYNTNINININSSNLKQIEEEQKKDEISKDEICKEESLGSEIKDTVKCYICFDKITKPKMCPHCHRIACEKCLYNWFINLKKDKCGYCRLKSNFYEMVSVPFMDAVVDFVEKFFNRRNNVSETIDKEFLEYCPEHKNEMLYYYCLDCGKPYCKTCFVFFGEEKDKHIGHSIIEYEKYKNMSFPLLKKNTDKLDSNIQHVEENIKRCMAYKNAYEHERKFGNKFIKHLQDEFNKQIDGIISVIDDQIKKLKEYINEYNKYKKEVDDFYGAIKHKKNSNDKSCESLIIKLTKINQQKFFSSKDIEKLNDLSKNMCVNTYMSKVGEFNHENIFLSKGLKLGSSPYEIVIDNKQRNEVQISLMMPKERTSITHNFHAFIFIRKKGECIQTYDLDEFKEDDNSFYLKKKIPWDYFGQSIFKVRGVLYDFYFS